VVSKQDLDQAKATLDAAQAQMDSLASQVNEQEVQLHYYKVVAPRAGIVGDVPVRVGDRVTVSTQLTTVDQPGSLEAYVYVPIEHSAQLKMNLPVQIIGSDGKVLADSRISFISPQVDNTTQTVLVKARILNGNDALRQSQFIRARVVWGTHPNPQVPILAVSRLAGQYFAFVAEPQDGGSFVARQKPLQIGQTVGNDYEVQGGLKAGDKVIISGTQFLRDGAPVVPMS
jgi:RND family efflux transporter MFP subunit